MKIEVMEKWVEALESKEYTQGSNCLRYEGKYCCLGVLCEIAKKEGVIEEFRGLDSYLPLDVQKWAGMQTDRGWLSASTLAKLNDGREAITKQIKTKKGDISVRYGRKMSFKNIAKVIKEYYKEL